MNNTIQYKGYVGSVEFSEEDGIFYGKVMGIRSLISYEGESARELLDDFHDAVDDYLEICKAEGKEPEVAFKDSFNIRLSPDLHKKSCSFIQQPIRCLWQHYLQLVVRSKSHPLLSRKK